MRLELTGRRVDISLGIRRIVDRKLQKLERLLQDGAISAHVVLSREKTFNRAEITIHLRDDRFLHAAGEGATWHAPLTQAAERLAQQARTTKGKYQARKRKTVGRGEQKSDAVPTGRRRAVAPEAPPRVASAIKQVRQKVRQLSLANAIQQLPNNGVLVFRIPDTSRLSILYRAADGDLTLVEADV